MKFQLMYPDVLGAVADKNRIFNNDLQFAVGIFPKQAFINQPIEVVVLLQNMVDQNMQVKVAIQLPTADKQGHPIIVDTPKAQISLGLRPGEVGVLRMPIVANPPSPPGQGYPIRVAVRYRTPKDGARVRPPDGGPPPSVLGISPFKLQVLRDVNFAARQWNESADIITVTFDLVAKRLPASTQELKPRYETLWTAEDMVEEEKLVSEYIDEARRLATHLVDGSSFPDLLPAVKERFALRGMPLHPGEARAIAKMMAYTVDEAPNLEMSIKFEGTRWFRALCQVLAHDPDIVEDLRRGEIFAKYMFDAIIFDAIGFGFKVLQPKVKENLGNLEERLNYANRILVWLAGQGQPDLNYVYLPLVLGGVVVNRLVRYSREESPWAMVDELYEAHAGRLRLEVPDETVLIFNILQQLLDEISEQLTRQRVPRE